MERGRKSANCTSEKGFRSQRCQDDAVLSSPVISHPGLMPARSPPPCPHCELTAPPPRTQVWQEAIPVPSSHPTSCSDKASETASYWTGENHLSPPCPRIRGRACNMQVGSRQEVRTTQDTAKPWRPGQSYPQVKIRTHSRDTGGRAVHSPLSLAPVTSVTSETDGASFCTSTENTLSGSSEKAAIPNAHHPSSFRTWGSPGPLSRLHVTLEFHH